MRFLKIDGNVKYSKRRKEHQIFWALFFFIKAQIWSRAN